MADETPPGDAGAADVRAANPADAVQRFVSDLEQRFRAAVQRALRFELDGSVTSLAVVDHYLATARDEQREPILSLLAAGAGAYFGELVRRHIGGIWLGDGREPRHLRLLLTPAFVYCSPVDLAFAAILGDEPDPDDARLPEGLPLDLALHLDTGLRPLPHTRLAADPDDPPPDPAEPGAPPKLQPHDDGSDDATWVGARLAELAPVPADQFYSLTTRWETLELILELLAARRAEAGYAPYAYRVEDYLHAFS